MAKSEGHQVFGNLANSRGNAGDTIAVVIISELPYYVVVQACQARHSAMTLATPLNGKINSFWGGVQHVRAKMRECQTKIEGMDEKKRRQCHRFLYNAITAEANSARLIGRVIISHRA